MASAAGGSVVEPRCSKVIDMQFSPRTIAAMHGYGLVRSARVALLVFSALLSAAAQAQAAQTATPAVGSAQTCPVRKTPASPAEEALSQGDLSKAESLFREESKAPGVDGDRARDGLVRTLLREEKFDEAQRVAADWHTAAPQNGLALASVGEVAWRRGQINEALQLFNAAAKVGRCNARLAANRAAFFQLYGMNASAAVQLNFAHELDPIDPDITGRWDAVQPRAVRLQNVQENLAHADSLTPERRKSLERWRDRLSAPPSDACHLKSSVTSTSIPFQRIQNGPHAPVYWGLDVAFNGKQRRLEIDTGAHGLLLSRSAANALHLEPLEQGKSFGMGDEGALSSHRSHVESIKIGGLEFENCDVDILEADSKALATQDGLIGGDVFSNFILTFDFPGRLLKLDPLPPLPDAQASAGAPTLETGSTSATDAPARDVYVDPTLKSWTRVFRSGHDLILPISINSGPLRLFIVDTGAQFDSVSPEAAREVGKISKGSYVDIVGISGKVNKTYTTGPVTLSFANMRYPSQGMLGLENTAVSRDVGVEIAGFLGAETLHELTMQIDYRDDLIHFSYDPKRVQRCSGMNSETNLGDCY